MVHYYEKRADVRKLNKSPITVEDLNAGKTYRARMVNYSKNGLYFETDWLLESGTEICIEMENLPKVSSFLDLKERYRAEIIWHTKLEDSLCSHGYGVRYISGSDKEKAKKDSGDTRSGIDRRKFQYTAYIPERRIGKDRRSPKERRRESERRASRKRGDTRSGIDRRKFQYTAYIPERRTGKDRRSLIERRREPERRASRKHRE